VFVNGQEVREVKSVGHYNHERSMMTRGVRNNNPGNMEPLPHDIWRGQVGDDGRFLIFETPEHGIRAMAKDIMTKFLGRSRHVSRPQTTVSQIIMLWAPPMENDTKAYIDLVCERMEVGEDEELDLFDDRVQLARMIGAMVEMENGFVYEDDVLMDGVEAAFTI